MSRDQTTDSFLPGWRHPLAQSCEMATYQLDDEHDLTVSTEQLGKAQFTADGRVYNKTTAKATQIRVKAEGRTAWKAHERAIAEGRRRLREAS